LKILLFEADFKISCWKTSPTQIDCVSTDLLCGPTPINLSQSRRADEIKPAANTWIA